MRLIPCDVHVPKSVLLGLFRGDGMHDQRRRPRLVMLDIYADLPCQEMSGHQPLRTRVFGSFRLERRYFSDTTCPPMRQAAYDGICSGALPGRDPVVVQGGEQLQEVASTGVRDRLQAALHPELAQDVADVALYGAYCHD